MVWSLDHLDGFLAWLPERLAAVEPVPELIDLADRAAQHAHAFRCARLDFRRTYGRQPRKAEALALGPWMQHVERYRQRAEQLCAGRPELLRWYLDHIDIVVAAPSWTSYEIGTSREHGRRLLLQAEAATTSHPARAVVS